MKTVPIALFAGMIGCAFVPSEANAITLQEHVLYSFCGAQNCRDGKEPNASLLEMKGKLFGTTLEGGDTKGGDHQGGGTVFKLDPNTGAEEVLHGFCRRNAYCTDGESPAAGLIRVNGALFGTTATGGDTYGCCGTAFSVDPATHVEKVLYTFCSQQNCADGAAPVASLINVKGTLYGTTAGSGPGVGTIFSLDPSTGEMTVLHSFYGGSDGLSPLASLINVKGTLYGTTTSGGSTGCGGHGCGTVYSFDPSTSAENVLYSFCSQQNCADGANPASGLINVNGMLYGTTSWGGAGCGAYCGTVFSLDPQTGVEKVVYSFCSQQNCADGDSPFAGLIDVNGVLYGATAYGGNAGCDTLGCGTVFSLDPQKGVETVVYAFCNQQNCVDGSKPVASLINVNGVLYGTTETGGTNNEGTVFALMTGDPIPR